MTQKCECCKKFEVQWTLKDQIDENIEYNVCSNCLDALINRNLSKKQFKNLLTNGHTIKEFLLHDDFYDDDGTALQPRE